MAYDGHRKVTRLRPLGKARGALSQLELDTMTSNCSNTLTDVGLSGFKMADFDALPKGVRQALANANHNWNCTQINRAMKRGVRMGGKLRKFKSAEIISKIAEHDAKQAAAHYAYLETGLPFARD
jgi:hypothetical protein